MKVIAAAAAVAAVSVVAALPIHAHGGSPQVPPGLVVPAGHKLFLEGHAFGTQNYLCLPSASAPAGVAWINVGPQATLFADNGRQIITHFLSPNPDESGIARATWQHSRDTSAVWAAADADPVFVEAGAIPWLRLHFVGRQEGPTGGDSLSETTYIQRINTVGGVAPATGCAAGTDVGKRYFSPYEADYLFYKERSSGLD